jgi:hypothetical protein
MGDFQEVPIRDEACLEVSTNGLDLITQIIAPDILRAKINQLDMMYDHVESINPTFASYLIKPTDVINTFMSDGFEGVMNTFKEKGDNIRGSIPKDQPSILEHLSMAS